MTMNSDTQQHPHDLLEAFALDALDAVDEQDVSDHLERCADCDVIVNRHLAVTAAFAASVAQAAPPEGLRSRILEVVEPSASPSSPLTQSISVSTPRPSRSWSRVSSVVTGRWIRALVPAAAVLAVALVAITMVLNLQVSADLDEVQAENSRLQSTLDRNMATTTALSARSSETVNRMQGSLQRWQQTSYALAQPGNQTLVMTPVRADEAARGVLVVSEDQSAGVLMVSSLMPPEPGSVYHVWLTRGGQRYWAGEMGVDERGWGTMTLSPLDSLGQYDSLQLSMGMGVAAVMAAPPGSAERARATAGMVGDMILIASLN